MSAEQNSTEGVADPPQPTRTDPKTLYDIFLTGNNAAQVVLFCGKSGFRCESLSNAFQQIVRMEVLRPMKERFHHIYRGIQLVNGAPVCELEQDILSVVFAMNEWSKDWEGIHTPNFTEMQNGCLKILELTGDRNSINNLHQYAHLLGDLRVFCLGGEQQVSGDIKNFGALPKLTDLCLGWTRVSGDISSLKNLHHLTWLDLGQTRVFGDIASLKDLTNLKKIYLYFSDVSGDISTLSQLQNLTKIYLHQTRVTGKITSLSVLRNLTDVNLYQTLVSGDGFMLENKLPKCSIFF